MSPKFHYKRVVSPHNPTTHVDSLIRQTDAGWQVASAIGIWPPEPPWADFALNEAEMAHAMNLSQAYFRAHQQADPGFLIIRNRIFSPYRALYRPQLGVVQFATDDGFIQRLPAHISFSDPESVIVAYELYRELSAMVMVWRLAGHKPTFLPTATPRSDNREKNCVSHLSFGFDEDWVGRSRPRYANYRNDAEGLVAS